MKKIEKIEDMMSLVRSTGNELGKDFLYGGDLIDEGLIALPADEPDNGTFGCLVLNTEDDKSMKYVSKVYDPCEKIRCGTAEEFFEKLQKSLDADYPTFMSDDPRILRIGFISLRNSGNLHFSLRIGTLKRYLKEKES